MPVCKSCNKPYYNYRRKFYCSDNCQRNASNEMRNERERLAREEEQRILNISFKDRYFEKTGRYPKSTFI